MLIGGAVVVLALVGGGLMMLNRGGGDGGSDADSAAAAAGAAKAQPATPAATPPRPTAAESAAAAAAALGYFRIIGDLPADAVVWVDGTPRRGRIVQATPGDHVIEIETSEFQAWDTTVTVRAGDTLRVLVELVLKPDSTLR